MSNRRLETAKFVMRIKPVFSRQDMDACKAWLAVILRSCKGNFTEFSKKQTKVEAIKN